MSRNKALLAILMLVGAVVFWWMGRPPPPVPPESAPARPNAVTTTNRASAVRDVENAEAGSTPVPPAAVVPSSRATDASQPAQQRTDDPVDKDQVPEAPVTPRPPEQEAIQALRLTVRTYGQKFLGNPVGNNAEITAALNGGNPKGIRYLEGQGTRINDRGELVDEWGTPYFFHQLSRDEMEIHSAGPDRKMGTSDDLIVK